MISSSSSVPLEAFCCHREATELLQLMTSVCCTLISLKAQFAQTIAAQFQVFNFCFTIYTPINGTVDHVN